METVELYKGGETVVVTPGGADEALWTAKGYSKAGERPKAATKRARASKASARVVDATLDGDADKAGD